MIDTHCHLTFKNFAGRVEEVLFAAKVAGVRGVITVGTTPGDCLAAQDLASRYDNVWCTAGIHPLSASDPRDWSMVKKVAAHPRCVAWGELGLDNHYDEPPRAAQRTLLDEQLEVIESVMNSETPSPQAIMPGTTSTTEPRRVPPARATSADHFLVSSRSSSTVSKL